MFMPTVRYAALGLTLCLASSCDEFRNLRNIEEAQGVDTTASADQAPTDADPLQSGFDRVCRLFLQSGATPIIADHRIALERGETHDRVLKLSIGSCYSFVAFADGVGFDPDLILDSPGGQTVARDVSPDPFPVIASYCPIEPGFYALRVRSARGEGEVLYGAYELVGPSAQAERRLAELRDRYLAEARALGPANRVGVPQRGDHEMPVALLPGRCYGVVAVSDIAAVDIDLALLDGTGEPLARDIGLDAEPVIQEVCATDARAHRLRIEGYDGGGVVWWQLFEVARTRQP